MNLPGNWSDLVVVVLVLVLPIQYYYPVLGLVRLSESLLAVPGLLSTSTSCTTSSTCTHSNNNEGLIMMPDYSHEIK
jgi:hypothetical protein